MSTSKLLVQIVPMSVITAEQLSLCTALNRILLHFTTNYLFPRTLQMLTSQSVLAGTDWSSGAVDGDAIVFAFGKIKFIDRYLDRLIERT